MNDFLEDVVIPILSMVLIMVLVFGLVIGGVNLLEKHSCEEKADVMDLNWKHSIWTGCMLKTSKGQYIDSEDYHSYIRG